MNSLAEELTKEFYGRPRWETEPKIPECANIAWIKMEGDPIDDD